MPQQWEQGCGLEDNHHEVRSLKITVSIAEYMEQQLEDDKSTLVLCQIEKLVVRNMIQRRQLCYFRRCLLCISLDCNHFPANSFTFVGYLCIHRIYLYIYVPVARLTAPFALSTIRCHIQLAVTYMRVFSYSYVYFDARKTCQTYLSGPVLSITTV